MAWSLFVRVSVFRAFWGNLVCEAPVLGPSEHFDHLRDVMPDPSRVRYSSDMDIDALQEDEIMGEGLAAGEEEPKSLKQLVSQLQDEQAARASVESEIARNTDRTNELERENKTLKAELDKLRAGSADQSREQALNMESLTNEISSTRAEKSDFEARYAAVQEENDTLTRELQGMRHQVNVTQEQLILAESRQDESQGLEIENADLKRKLGKAFEEMNVLQGIKMELFRLKDDLLWVQQVLGNKPDEESGIRVHRIQNEPSILRAVADDMTSNAREQDAQMILLHNGDPPERPTDQELFELEGVVGASLTMRHNLRGLVQETISDKTNLSQELSSLKELTSFLQVKIEKMSQEKAVLQEEVTRCRSRDDVRKGDLAELKTRQEVLMKQLRSAAKTSDQTVQTVQINLRSLQARLAEMQSAAEAEKSQWQKQQSQITQLSLEWDTNRLQLEKERDLLKAKVGSLTANIKFTIAGNATYHRRVDLSRNSLTDLLHQCKKKGLIPYDSRGKALSPEGAWDIITHDGTFEVRLHLLDTHYGFVKRQKKRKGNDTDVRYEAVTDSDEVTNLGTKKKLEKVAILLDRLIDPEAIVSVRIYNTI